MGLEDIVDKIKELVNFGINAAAKCGTEAVTSPVKALTGAAKDASGIRRDFVETKLAQKRLENEESLIQKATLEDVKQYDPATQKLLNIIIGSPRRIYLISDSDLRDMVCWANGRIVGSIRQVDSRRWVARDKRPKIVAIYDLKRNRTYRPDRRSLGPGNNLQQIMEQQHSSPCK